MLYAAAREHVYVGLHKALVFQHQGVAPPLVLNAAMVQHAGGAEALSARPTTADREAQYWDRCVVMEMEERRGRVHVNLCLDALLWMRCD